MKNIKQMAKTRITSALFQVVIVIAATPQLPAAPNESAESSFSRHVQPLFTKLGCASLTCHGAFHGQEGFRLSLFGRLPKEDHQQLTERIDVDDPEYSYLFEKATGQLDHGGGRVLAEDSFEYDVLEQWIGRGAQFDAAATTTALRIEPREIVVGHTGTRPLRVTATRDDGSQEDVTRYVTFSVVDDAVASIDAAGHVHTKQISGATPVVAQYGTIAAHATVVVPAESASSTQLVPATTDIDHFINRRLQVLGVKPSARCSDDEFMRRVTLDLCGRLPRPEEVLEFTADANPGKRAKLVHKLLRSDGYAQRWASWFAGLSGCVTANDQGIKVAAGKMQLQQADYVDLWVDWYAERLKRDEPCDEIVKGFLVGKTRGEQSFVDYLTWEHKLRHKFAEDDHPGRFYAQRKSIDLPWKAFGRDKEGIPKLVASSFMGIQLECAQCHDHPMDFWKQQDYEGFAAVFKRVKATRAPDWEAEEKQSIVVRVAGFGGAGVLALILANVFLIRRRHYRSAVALFAIEAAAVALVAYFLTGYVHVFSDRISPALFSPGKVVVSWVEQYSSDQRWLTPSLIALGATVAVVICGLAWIARRQRRRPLLGMLLVGAMVFLGVSGTLTIFDARHVAKQSRLRRPLLNSLHRHWLTFWEVKLLPPDDQQTVKPCLLDGTTIDETADDDPRQALADWLCDKSNPYFARNIVNRVWAEYFGRGLVDPVEDMSQLNPPTHPELLDWLAEKFKSHDFSLSRLHETIILSDTYQRSWQSNESNRDVANTYARFHPRRLSGEALIDAIQEVSGRDMRYGFGGAADGTSAYRLPGMYPGSATTGAMGTRILCTGDSGSNDMRVEGALYCMIEDGLQEMIAHPAGRVAQLVSEHEGPTEIATELYLLTVSRPPTQQELDHILNHVSRFPDRRTGWQDVMWALINTEEFQFNH